MCVGGEGGERRRERGGREREKEGKREREGGGKEAGGRWREERSITIISITSNLWSNAYTLVNEENILTSTYHCIVRMLLDSTCLYNQSKFTLRIGYIKTVALHKQ